MHAYDAPTSKLKDPHRIVSSLLFVSSSKSLFFPGQPDYYTMSLRSDGLDFVGPLDDDAMPLLDLLQTTYMSR